MYTGSRIFRNRNDNCVSYSQYSHFFFQAPGSESGSRSQNNADSEWQHAALPRYGRYRTYLPTS